MSETPKLTVIIPAYNEVNNLRTFLPQVIDYCRQNQWNVIVINDGSTDGTKTYLNQFPLNEQIRVLHHKLNAGYGAAIKYGLRECETPLAITIDADGQHYLEDIPRLLKTMELNDADLVVGSRKGIRSASSIRGIGKRTIRLIARILMTVPIYDLNSGMKLYRTGLARKYLDLAPDTMSFSDIITLIFINHKHLVLEEPIRIKERKHGKSTIGMETAFQTVMELINIVILFNPMKIFLPLSLLCILITAAWGIPLIIEGRGVSMGSVLGIITGILLFLLGLIAEQLSLIRRNQHK